MAWKRLLFRTIGGLAVLSMPWGAAAEHIWAPPSTSKGLSESTAATGEWRPVGSASASRNAVRRLPPVESPPANASADWGKVGKAVERVIERHADGSVKVERHVVRDAEGHAVNHGAYTSRDRDGTIVRSGEFRGGKLHGKWLHRFDHDTGHLFSESDDNRFTGPFVSEATFDDGLLHGVWSIKTASGNNVLEWRFEHGDRQGKSTWWYANGEKRLEATYRNGVLHGDVVEWGPDGKLAKRGTYVKGRHLAKKVEWYAPGRKHFEGYSLGTQIAVEPIVDWWTATATVTPPIKAGRADKHGLWTAWYPTGVKQTEGNYEHDLPAGTFTWWYADGTKQAEGTYRTGVKDGTWRTWHPNGAKESQTEYRQGVLTGQWMHWNTQGKLVEVRDFSDKRDSAAKAGKNRTVIGRRPTGNVQTR